MSTIWRRWRFRLCAIALVVVITPAARAADPAAPPCKDGAATCMPWERDWSNTTLPPGAVVTSQGTIYAPHANPTIEFLYNWQSLIAGGLGLLAGIIAFLGALIAANRQVKTARQAAAEQVGAVQRQLDDARAAREEDEQHRREIERAYVSGGGARAIIPLRDEAGLDQLDNASRISQIDGSTILLVPTGRFELHINNHGKTPAYLHHVAFGFCDVSALPPEPVYQAPFPFSDAIGPGVQSRIITTVHIPEDYARTAICGRYYWDDIWGRHWSSGFVYEIPSGAAHENASISIEASPAYWDTRPDDPPRPELSTL
jgi:hypothetical protein